MAKGISLEEFRNNLEGDAQKKVKELEEKVAAQNNTINTLSSEKRHFHQILEVKDKQMHNLFNRCKAFSGTTMCPFCGLRPECFASMKKYGVTMPTREEVSTALLRRCHNIVKQYEANNPEKFEEKVVLEDLLTKKEEETE